MDKTTTISKTVMKYLVIIFQSMGAFIKKIWMMFQEYREQETRFLALRNTAIQNEQTAFILMNEISSFLEAVAPILAKYGIDRESYLHIRFLGVAGNVFLLAIPKKNLSQDFHPNQLDLIARRLNGDIGKFREMQVMMYGARFPDAYPCLFRGIQFVALQDNSVEIIMKVQVQ